VSREPHARRAEGFLVAMERAYLTTLRAELVSCMNGSRGLFGRNEGAASRLRSPGVATLLERGAEIEELRKYLGLEPYALHQRYLELRAIRHSTAPGEPKLARLFLAELPAVDDSLETARA
jgi:hypothetical protein